MEGGDVMVVGYRALKNLGHNITVDHQLMQHDTHMRDSIKINTRVY